MSKESNNQSVPTPPAYIQVEDTNAIGLPNLHPTIPFRRNSPCNFGAAKDLPDEPDFWTHELVFAYQGDENKDRDPTAGENHVVGTTKEGSGWSAIFLEVIREDTIGNPQANLLLSASGKVQYRNDYFNHLFGVIAHEIGHAPGHQDELKDHAEEGLMKKGADSITEPFKPITILRFRKTKSWND